MPFLNSAQPTSINFWVDPQCASGFFPATAGVFQGPAWPGLSLGKVRAARTPPASTPKIPDDTGIYAFSIDLEGSPLPKRYVGKASSLCSRFRDYTEMVRRLLALYAGYEVWTDGNGFRYVHHEIALAIQMGTPVVFEYFVPGNVQSAQALARLEQLEIAASVMSYHNAGHYDYLLLNSMDNIRSSVHSMPDPKWQAVQRLL